MLVESKIRLGGSGTIVAGVFGRGLEGGKPLGMLGDTLALLRNLPH
jgi:hypothetical protein